MVHNEVNDPGREYLGFTAAWSGEDLERSARRVLDRWKSFSSVARCAYMV